MLFRPVTFMLGFPIICWTYLRFPYPECAEETIFTNTDGFYYFIVKVNIFICDIQHVLLSVYSASILRNYSHKS